MHFIKDMCEFLPEASKYLKIPKISLGTYFSKALFERLIVGGAYVRRKICVSKSIGLALWLEVNLPFLSVLLNVFEGNFQVQAPRGDYIWRGDLTEGFLRYDFGGFIHGGDYFRNFTVRWFGLEGDVFPQFITKLFLFLDDWKPPAVSTSILHQ